MPTNNHKVAPDSDIQWIAGEGGRLVGYRDRYGNEYVVNCVASPTGLPDEPQGLQVSQVSALQALVGGSVGLSGVTYDGSNRCIGFAVEGKTYTVAYNADSRVVTGSDGSVLTISLDGSGRISGVSAA